MKKVGIGGLGTINGVTKYGGNASLGIWASIAFPSNNVDTGTEIEISLMSPIFKVIESANESGLVSSSICPGKVSRAKSVILPIVSGSNFP